jgi:hypothetical protein
MIEQINQLKQGSIISESSHYIVNRVSGSNAWLTHFESGEDRVLRGYKIQLEYHRGVKQDNSYSLDRIDSSKGYVKGNIWVISLRANRIKNDSTPQELRLIADKVEERLLQSNNSYKEE